MSSGRRKHQRHGFHKTIGARLTLWGTLTTLTVCAVVCVTLYLGLRYSLYREVDGFLEGEVQEFCAILHEEEGDSLSEVEEEIRHELGSRLRSDLTFRLLDEKGRLVLTSNPDDQLPNPRPREGDVDHPAESPWCTTLQPGTGACPIRVCSQWTPLPDGSLHLAQATYLLDRVSASLSALARLCIAAMVVAAVLSVIGGWLLARRSLRPVHRMTETAKNIGATRLSDRLERSGNQDELDRLAETLNRMLDRIERQFNRMQQFTADAAHELRTPLTALRGSAEVAMAGDPDETALRLVIEESIHRYDHLARIADDLLLLARLDAGEVALRREHLELDRAVRDVIDLYAPLAADRGITLNLDRCEPVILAADKVRVRQVLSNLLDNCVKYLGAGDRIDVTLIRANSRATITVSDTGPGISARDLPHVFDRFYRGDRARAVRREPGAGLGLPICRCVVEAHGGHLDIQSQPNIGTTVTVSFPLDTDVPASAPSARARPDRVGHVSAASDQVDDRAHCP